MKSEEREPARQRKRKKNRRESLLRHMRRKRQTGLRKRKIWLMSFVPRIPETAAGSRETARDSGEPARLREAPDRAQMPERHARKEVSVRRVRPRRPVRQETVPCAPREASVPLRQPLTHVCRARQEKAVPQGRTARPARQGKAVRAVPPRPQEVHPARKTHPVMSVRPVPLLRGTARQEKGVRTLRGARTVRKEASARGRDLSARDVLPVTEEDRARREAAGISVRELRGSVRTEEEIPAEKTESHFPLPS